MASASSDAGAVEPQVSYAACHQALDTAELLEEILTHLPTKDLLFAQGICRQWKGCIDYSKRLQQGLFFRAPGDRTAVDLVQQLLDTTADGAKDPSALAKLNKSLRFMTVNPLMHAQFGTNGLSRSTTQPDHLCRSDEAYLRPEASWRRMLRSYPMLKTCDEGLTKMVEAFWADQIPSGPMFSPILAVATTHTENIICSILTSVYEKMAECETTADLERYWAEAEVTDSDTSN